MLRTSKETLRTKEGESRDTKSSHLRVVMILFSSSWLRSPVKLSSGSRSVSTPYVCLSFLGGDKYVEELYKSLLDVFL